MLTMQVHSFQEKNFWVGSHNSDMGNRDAVLNELREFFGVENVAPITNINSFKVKSLTKDLAKFYGIPYEESNNATRSVEQEVRKAVTKHGDDKNLFVLTYEEGLKYSPSFKEFFDKYPQVGESMKVLNMQNKSLGRHAGGVLICDDLPEKMPLITSKGEVQTPWVEGTQFKHLEKCGNFIKLDLLGLDTLRLIETTVKSVIRNQGGVILLTLDNDTEVRVNPDEMVLLSDLRRVRASEMILGDEPTHLIRQKVNLDGSVSELLVELGC